MSLPAGARIGGIDAPLPPGEAVRWQGGPSWRPLFWRAFHGRTVTAYFGLLAAWHLGAAALGTKSWAAAVGAVVFLLLLGVFCLGCSALLAWMAVRSTVYAITDRRVVLKVGIVIPSVVNIPFRMIESVALLRTGHGHGDLAVKLAGTDRIAYTQLWPHARPWRFTHPEPAMRALPDSGGIGKLLQQALADAQEVGTLGTDAPSPVRQQERLPMGTTPTPAGGGLR